MIDLEKEFEDKQYLLFTGDSLDKLKEIPDNSIDSIVTDPPYGLGKEPDAIQMLKDWVETGHHDVKSKTGFMGKSWDNFVPQPILWRECLRVLKPGGHILSFAGTRTYDLVVLGLRLAGFEIRDNLAWVYGSGMPKSLDVSKAIDKELCIERVVTREGNTKSNLYSGKFDQSSSNLRERRDKPESEEAKQWDGWKSSLKPAHEPIVLARKPLDGTIAQNVLKWHTGALNIDECRVPHTTVGDGSNIALNSHLRTHINGGNGGNIISTEEERRVVTPNDIGRFPSNFIHDGSDEVTSLFPDSNGAGKSLPQVKITGYGDGIGKGKSEYTSGDRIPFESGSGSAARFFYSAKTTKADRDAGCEDLETGNNHVTVKPTTLMEYLVKLITPPNGIVLDPFSGSGSTGKAAMLNNFNYIGFELDQHHNEIAKRRIEYAITNKESIKKELTKKKASTKISHSVKETELKNSLEPLFN